MARLGNEMRCSDLENWSVITMITVWVNDSGRLLIKSTTVVTVVWVRE